MPKPRWAEEDPPSEFGRMVREYMWSHRPPLSARGFADLVEVQPPTVGRWLSGVIPDEDATLDRIAERTGLPRMRVYAAAGRLPRDGAADSRTLYEELKRRVERDADMAPDVRAAIQRTLAELGKLLGLPDGDGEGSTQQGRDDAGPRAAEYRGGLQLVALNGVALATA